MLLLNIYASCKLFVGWGELVFTFAAQLTNRIVCGSFLTAFFAKTAGTRSISA
jgi:hypothetical protein